MTTRRVTVAMTVEYDIDVPADWDAKAIECQRNDGCWCSDNAFREVLHFRRSLGKQCMCSRVKYRYVKEAEQL